MIAFVWNDLVKSTALGATVVATLACAAWRVGGAINDAPPAQPGKVVEIADGRSAAKSPVAQRPTFDPDLDRAESAAVDPFLPLVPEPTLPANPSPAEPAKGLAPSGPLAPVFGAIEASKADVRPVGAPEAALGSPMRAAPPMRLTGTVVGPNPTAIVMIGEDERVVRPGGKLPDGSTVVKIERTSVTLARGGERSVLQVAE